MHVAHRVKQTRHLFLAGLDDVWIRVACGGDAERGGQIEIFFAVGVPDKNILGAFPDNWPRAVGFNEDDISRLEILEQLQRFFYFGHEFTIFDLRFTRVQTFRRNGKSQIANRKSLNAALFRRPDDFVLLDLKADGQRVGDDFFRQVFSRNRSQVWRNFFQ
jgi:hypothetical protein